MCVANNPSVGTQDTIASRHVSVESKNAREQPQGLALWLTGLAVEETGFIPRKIEVGIFLIDLLVAVDPILLRIVPHGVIPPIKERLILSLVDGIAIAAAGVVLDQSGRDVVDLTISAKGIEHDEETGLVVIQFIDPCIEIGFSGEGIRAPSW